MVKTTERHGDHHKEVIFFTGYHTADAFLGMSLKETCVPRVTQHYKCTTLQAFCLCQKQLTRSYTFSFNCYDLPLHVCQELIPYAEWASLTCYFLPFR